MKSISTMKTCQPVLWSRSGVESFRMEVLEQESFRMKKVLKWSFRVRNILTVFLEWKRIKFLNEKYF